ncbi:D-hexose-6-phosphate mutarotase [Shewanella sp. NIFS-20-20]|uniref:D-hexose-6-phosphate mutarotase n=1 Tax=Shewanella sp. NIFS-20-20 TaxID=2853806 RepID=UPI001C460057|nr:D-hexose-6-phosphate mutarotase [Shewanella sp. NIFS-20-20]MBV7316603.1 D-hexose-6-phosphate mutarotase [Shewanella sp. NIFS-20-20]
MASVTTKKHHTGLDYVDIDTQYCQARIFMQGAQIDQFQPKGKAPLLWVSSADDYQAGQGIRGGIPVCWPWFGMHANADWPQHGFARTRQWQLNSVQMKNDIAILKFVLTISEQDKQYWPHDTQVSIEFELSDRLKVSLINHNTGSETVTLTQALHSYFAIEDIHQLQATGFNGSQYIEFGQGPYPQEGDSVRFDKETDRVYTQLGTEQQLHTPNGTMMVKREHSQSAVLWNPWIDKSSWLSRFNHDDYLQMVCLEAANVLEDKLVLAPGERHCLTTEIYWLD